MSDPITEARKIISGWTAAPVAQRNRLAPKTMAKLARLLLHNPDPARTNPLTGQPNSADDILDDPTFKAYTSRVLGELVPKMQNSGFVMSLVPKGETDVKYAVELGVSIMLNKPIIAIIDRDTPLPPKLEIVADEVVRVEFGNLAASKGELLAAISRVSTAIDGDDSPDVNMDNWNG